MEHYDVVVIGGGVAGTSCLYQLTRNGVNRALLVEKTAIAAGSSGRSAAFIETQYDDADRVRLGLYAQELLEQLRNEFEVPFVQCGKLLLALTSEDLVQLQASADLQRQLGGQGVVLAAGQVADIAPQLRTDDLAGALYGSRDGYTDPPRLCQLFIDLAQRGGASYRPCEVTEVIHSRGRITGVVTSAGPISCDAVVNATGPWASAIGEMAGIPVPVRGYRREVVVLEDGATDAGEMPIVVESLGSVDRNLYLRGDGQGLLLAGIHFEGVSDEEAADPDRFDESVGWSSQEQISELVRARHRNGDELALRVGWAGLYPLSADRRPIIGESREVEGFWNLAGLGGNGIQLSPGFAAVVAEELSRGHSDLLPDLTQYRLERFSVANTA